MSYLRESISLYSCNLYFWWYFYCDISCGIFRFVTYYFECIIMTQSSLPFHFLTFFWSSYINWISFRNQNKSNLILNCKILSVSFSVYMITKIRTFFLIRNISRATKARTLCRVKLLNQDLYCISVLRWRWPPSEEGVEMQIWLRI